MRRLIQCIIVLLALVLSGCPDYAVQVQAQTANAIGAGANTALPILVERYNQEGLRAIDKAQSRQEAEAAILHIKNKWLPIWKAWESMRIAQDHWATVLEQGGDMTAALIEMKNAYCELMVIWPEDIPAIPLAPIACPNLAPKAPEAPEAIPTDAGPPAGPIEAPPAPGPVEAPPAKPATEATP
jgi:hypothetical protein